MSKIKIKNFGPIKIGCTENNGWIDIKKVTLFIGNQGSGKSTVAKVISTFTWIEKALIRGDFNKANFGITRLKKHLAYQNIDGYFKPDTIIDYRGDAFHIEYDGGKISIEQMYNDSYVFPKIMYIPSERNFTSSVKNVYELRGLPQTLYTFSDEVRLAKDEYENKSLELLINDAKFEYRKSGGTWILGDDYEVEISKASSGFQSFVPMFIVSKYLSELINKEKDPSKHEISINERQRIKNEIQKIYSNRNYSDEVKNVLIEQLSKRIKYGSFVNIVEEPEQNLFPTSQKKMLFSLIGFAYLNEGSKLIMTSHSPYLINYLTLAVKADSVKNKLTTTKSIDKLNEIVPIKSTVHPDDLIIYELNEKDGSISILEDYKGLPSDENYLNDSLGETNELYAQLQQIEKGWL